MYVYVHINRICAYEHCITFSVNVMYVCILEWLRMYGMYEKMKLISWLVQTAELSCEVDS